MRRGAAVTKRTLLVVSSVAFTVFSCSTYFWVGSNFESRLLSFLVYAVLPLLGLYEAIRFYQGKSVGIGLIEALEKDPDKRRAILLVAHVQMALPILASL